ncbi:MAG TPA: hypothetical protein ACFCUC_06835 [Desulfobacterales bacterium]
MTASNTANRRGANRFADYLTAKKALDDRSLNRTVVEELRRLLDTDRSLCILEVGAGIGTMIERMLQWGLLNQAVYTALDADAGLLPAARNYLQNAAERHGWQWDCDTETHWRLSSNRGHVDIHWHSLDVTGSGVESVLHRNFDGLIAHAFLDLVDLDTFLSRLKTWVRPHGWLYLTLNFDGETLLLPTIDADFDARIVRLYHRSMDERRISGRPSGNSRTGRLLLQRLVGGNTRVLAAGSSDWVVFPQQGGYPPGEADFLHYLIDTIADQLDGHRRIDAARLREWTRRRHRQVDEGILIFVAKQLDVLART